MYAAVTSPAVREVLRVECAATEYSDQRAGVQPRVFERREAVDAGGSAGHRPRDDRIRPSHDESQVLDEQQGDRFPPAPAARRAG